jgi:hypothetical protein
VAHNLLTLYKSGDAERIRRKLHERMSELDAAVEAIRPIVEAHFKAQGYK